MNHFNSYTVSVLILFILNSCKPHSPATMESSDQDKVDTTPMVIDEKDIDYNPAEWTEMTTRDDVTIDIRYATANNFVKEPIYPCGRCFLRPNVAEALKKVNATLNKQGYKLKLFDCYRPSSAQQILWNKVPNPNYVARPWEGSMHSRGSAIDLTMTDLNGNEIDMGTTYDFFGPEAHQDYNDLPESILANRRLLKGAMEAEGFHPTRTEWWHFSFGNHEPPLSDWQWPCQTKSDK